MYAYIKGILQVQAQDCIVVEAGGIGYRIFTTAETMRYLPQSGNEIKVYTYLYIREDAMLLYGFFTENELSVFKLLLGVSGVGPKAALAVLSVMTADDLRFAVLSEDAKTIAKAPGIGPKTAKRLILELKDKLSLEDAFEKKEQNVREFSENNKMLQKNDAVLALTALGYSPSESLKAVNSVEITADQTVEDIIKAALKSISIL